MDQSKYTNIATALHRDVGVLLPHMMVCMLGRWHVQLFQKRSVAGNGEMTQLLVCGCVEEGK